MRRGRESGAAQPVIGRVSVLSRRPDMLRVAGSLITNQVRAYGTTRMDGRHTRVTWPLVAPRESLAPDVL